jgi:hypothetical protein
MVVFPTTVCLELGKETDHQVRASEGLDQIVIRTAIESCDSIFESVACS